MSKPVNVVRHGFGCVCCTNAQGVILSNLREISELRSSLAAERERAARVEALLREAQNAIRNQRGDDLCWIQNPENAEVARALPEAEFLESCKRYHAQITSERGTFDKGKTIAQLEAALAEEKLDSERLLLGLLKGEHSSLHIEFNGHACNYMDVRQAIMDGLYDHGEWVSEEEKQKAIETNRAWALQWYPETPVGFCCLFASSLEVLLDAARAEKGEQKG